MSGRTIAYPHSHLLYQDFKEISNMDRRFGLLLNRFVLRVGSWEKRWGQPEGGLLGGVIWNRNATT